METRNQQYYRIHSNFWFLVYMQSMHTDEAFVLEEKHCLRNSTMIKRTKTLVPLGIMRV